MPLPMPKGTRAKLRAQLTESLRRSRIFSNGRINPSSVRLTEVQALIQQGSALDKAASEFLGEQHITTFINSELRSIVLPKEKLSIPERSLGGVFPVSLADEIASQLISKFESLPWPYQFHFPLPGMATQSLPFDEGSIEVAPNTRLIAGWFLNNEARTSGKLSERGRPSATEVQWIESDIYIRVDIEGYVSRDYQSDTVLQAHERIFSLIGLLVAFQILETDYLWANGGEGRHPISISLLSNEIEPAASTLDLDSTYQTLANDLGYALRLLEILDKSPEIALEEVKHATSMCVDDRISSAAKWFLDSHTGNNAQVKFVQLMIAFETLLGDRQTARETGIANLMANRCAYMIGTSSTHRETLIAAFKEGYDIRSRIVHAGTSRLTHKEKVNFQCLQQLCADVIQHEAKILMAAN